LIEIWFSGRPGIEERDGKISVLANGQKAAMLLGEAAADGIVQALEIHGATVSIASEWLTSSGRVSANTEASIQTATHSPRYPAAANVWIRNAAHFPWLEERAAFAKTLFEFYRAVRPG